MVGMTLEASPFLPADPFVASEGCYVVVATHIPMKRVARRMKNIVFWKITQCSLIKVHRRFGGTYCFYLRGRRVRQTSDLQEVGDKPALGSSSVLLHTVAELFI
jgi:hypothetical protein